MTCGSPGLAVNQGDVIIVEGRRMMIRLIVAGAGGFLLLSPTSGRRHYKPYVTEVLKYAPETEFKVDREALAFAAPDSLTWRWNGEGELTVLHRRAPEPVEAVR